MSLNEHLQIAIKILQADIQQMGYTPIVQFELEGVSKPAQGNKSPPDTHHLNFADINAELKQQNILAILKPEYWQNQWEYASLMAGQTALKAAQDLDAAIGMLPTLLRSAGSESVLIQPVCWDDGLSNRPLLEKDNTKMIAGKAVHIPNSVQLNVSAFDHTGNNVLDKKGLGEALLQCFLHSSYECFVFYCSAEEAFARYTLKDKYDLHQELSSPVDISSGRMGGVLFHQDKDKNGNPIKNWQQHSRVEHRLGAASTNYNAYLNCVYALANLHDAILISRGEDSVGEINSSHTSALPFGLHGKNGAYENFRHGIWFEQKVNAVYRLNSRSQPLNRPLGTAIKQKVLSVVS